MEVLETLCKMKSRSKDPKVLQFLKGENQRRPSVLGRSRVSKDGPTSWAYSVAYVTDCFFKKTTKLKLFENVYRHYLFYEASFKSCNSLVPITLWFSILQKGPVRNSVGRMRMNNITRMFTCYCNYRGNFYKGR